MYIIDVLVVNRKAFAEFYEKYHGLISSVSAAIMTAHQPQLEFSLFVCLLIMVFINLWEMIACVESADKVAQM